MGEFVAMMLVSLAAFLVGDRISAWLWPRKPIATEIAVLRPEPGDVVLVTMPKATVESLSVIAADIQRRLREAGHVGVGVIVSRERILAEVVRAGIPKEQLS